MVKITETAIKLEWSMLFIIIGSAKKCNAHKTGVMII